MLRDILYRGLESKCVLAGGGRGTLKRYRQLPARLITHASEREYDSNPA